MPIHFFGFLQKRKTCLARDIGIALAMLLTCGFYACDARYFQNYMGQIRAVLAMLLILTLCLLSFTNGIHKRWGFPAALTAYFILPQAGIFLLRDKNLTEGFGKLVLDLCVLLGEWSFLALQDLLSRGFSVTLLQSVIFLLALSWIIYLAGRILRHVQGSFF